MRLEGGCVIDLDERLQEVRKREVINGSDYLAGV